MKKKIFMLLTVVAVGACMAAGCADKEKQDAAGAVQQTEGAGVQAGEESEQTTLCGVLDEKKDFLFIVTDEENANYVFSFEETPEGLDEAEVGDKVVVTYTGTISEIDAFTGEVLSVERQE